jgi:hypothetical protein
MCTNCEVPVGNPFPFFLDRSLSAIRAAIIRGPARHGHRPYLLEFANLGQVYDSLRPLFFYSSKFLCFWTVFTLAQEMVPVWGNYEELINDRSKNPQPENGEKNLFNIHV